MPNIIVLTGAGISAEFGIPTFRDSNGLWNNHDVNEVATPDGYRKNPELVHRFYNERRVHLKTVEPNAAHHALVKLEEAWNNTEYGFLLVTTNVDDLHERAGSKNVMHIHGNLKILRCLHCKHRVETSEEWQWDAPCPECRQPASMRPDVVWFGEMPYHLDKLEIALDNTHIYVAIGSSGSVMPASLFSSGVRLAMPHADIIEVNPKPSGISDFNRVIEDTASNAVPTLVDELIAKYL